MDKHFIIRALIIVFWLTIIAAVAAAADTISGADIVQEEVCQDNNGNNQQTCTGTNPATEVNSCESDVLLFDGVPNLPLQLLRNDGPDGGRLKVSSSTTPTTSLIDEDRTALSFAKQSRFGYDNTPNLESMLSNRIFHISPNGDHMGWYVYIPHDDEWCLREAMRLVARQIIISGDNNVDQRIRTSIDWQGPHRLVDEEGREYPHHTKSPRLHILLPRESFVHEAVAEGFVRTLSDGTTKLKTLSQSSPRVFVIDPILTIEECNELIDDSSTSFRRSGEKHYAPGFDNYRTSLTGSTPYDSRIAQKLWERVFNITAMPSKSGVEFPQLIKYETDVSWYKGHMDYFHTYNDKPLEDLRMFVRTRTKELVRLGNDDEEISNVLDAKSYERFDDIQLLIDEELCNRLAKQLLLSAAPHQVNKGDNNNNKCQFMHYYLLQSKMRIRDFSRASIAMAMLLLDENGATDALDLADKYFHYEKTQHQASILDQVEDYVPYFVKPIEFNRHVTVLPILREADIGGHTAFPHSTSSLGLDPADGETIEECKRGLIVKPSAGQALMFYNRLPSGELDPNSEHAGCSVQQGIKYAANCFNWDTDQKWAWRFQMNVDEWYR